MGSNLFITTLCGLAVTGGVLSFGAAGRFTQQPTAPVQHTMRRVEVRGISVDSSRPVFKQATVKLRVTDGNGTPVDCQTTLEMVPVFDEGAVARMKSTTCPLRSAG
jgi:hypothetical protein